MTKDLLEKLDIAARIALFVFSISVGMVVLLAGVKSASAATLRNEAVITGDYIRLGDIFEGVRNADYILGPAPAPGQDMILNSRALYRIASALDVRWTPATSMEQLIVRREAVVIPETDVTAALSKGLRAEGIRESFTLTYSGGAPEIVLPAGSERSVEISALAYDPNRESFTAVLVSPSVDNPLRRVSVAGQIERLIAVPVLRNSLRNGDIISAHDIDWIELPQSRIPNGALLNEAELLNMTPRRVAVSQRPLIANELEHPKMVDRGDSITIVFANGPITLTAKGRSLQPGAIGDTVRIANTDSNKNLQGIVTAHREVTIR